MSAPETSGFDDTDVAPMSYNFSKWLSNDHKQVPAGKRVIPEPSSEAVSQFGNDYARLIESGNALELEKPPEGDESAEDRDARIERNIVVAGKFQEQYEAERCRIFAEVCSGTPSAGELEQLPHRVRRAFMGYVVRSLNPEA